MSQRVTLTLKSGVTLPELQDAIAKLVAEAGCAGCGLNGFEFNLGVDPEEGWLRLADQLDVVSTINVAEVLDKTALGGLQQLGRFGG